MNLRDWIDEDAWGVLQARPWWQNILLFLVAPIGGVAGALWLLANWIF